MGGHCIVVPGVNRYENGVSGRLRAVCIDMAVRLM